MAKFEIITASRKHAKDILSSQLRWKIVGVISIENPKTPIPAEVKSLRKPVLRLEFHNIDDRVLSVADTSGYRAPMPGDINSIIRFGKKLIKEADKNGGIILCHCHMGLNRSTACALILRSIYLGKGKEKLAARQLEIENPAAMPNLRMISIADRMLERKGNLLRSALVLHP